MNLRISRTDYPDGGALWRLDGRPYAGVSTDREGLWTWWSRGTRSQRVVAGSRDEAAGMAQAAVEREVA